MDVLPAYAGMIPRHIFPSRWCASAPRVCGDDPRPRARLDYVGPCSPRMRG